MGYIVPISVFVILVVSSWDWLRKDNSWKPSVRGWIVIISGIVALLLGWHQYRSDVQENMDVLESIEREGTRLVPSDFQVKLVMWAHAAALIKAESDYEPPKTLSLSMNIDKISVNGDFVLRPPPAKEFSSRSPTRFWYYYGNALFVEGLNKLSYLDQLEGKTLRLYIPRRALGKPFTSKLAGIRAHIHIKGREFEIEQKETDSGIVEIQITRDMLTEDKSRP